MSFTTVTQGPTRFCAWQGPGRDPHVAYLDAAQLVVGGAELTTAGWAVWPDGTMYTRSGWRHEGAIEKPVLHRLAHAIGLILDDETECDRAQPLCNVAQGSPPMHWIPEFLATSPDVPADDDFLIERDHAVQLSRHRDFLFRAVYMDRSYVLEAGMVFGGSVRVWPCRNFSDAILAPSPKEAEAASRRVLAAFKRRGPLPSRDIARR